MRVPAWLTWRRGLAVAYLACAVIVTVALEDHPQAEWRAVYLLFAPCMLVAYSTPLPVVRHVMAAVACGILLVGGVASPLDMEVIEEAFCLVPLMYLMLYPGTGIAMLVAVLLLGPYLCGVGDVGFADAVEDMAELLVITAFASVMTYYQQRAHRLMLAYKDDSRTDYLTNLGNRLAYSLALKELEEAPAERRARVALLLVDLDDFKWVNDLLGHSYGDLLLRQFARRLEGLEHGRAFRIGGDEFAVLLDEGNGVDATRQAQDILHAARQPYQLLNRTVNVNASVGIAHYATDSTSHEQLERDADLALYQAKRRGKNGYSFFQPALLDARQRFDRLERDLHRALSDNQLFMVYQPKVDMTDGRIAGVEALVRWRHPDLGLVAPSEFIPVAEATRQIIPLGQWVLRQTCGQASEWLAAGHAVAVSVNVSAVQLEHDDIVGAVAAAMKEFDLPAGVLEIEVTETSIMADVERIIPVMQALRQLGVGLSVDDFGVAYSSLNQLTRLPLNVLKIDKSFVDHCHEDARKRVMVRTLVHLAENLSMAVIAEGVELEAQREVLLAEGCRLAQGYLFHRPQDGEAISALLAGV